MTFFTMVALGAAGLATIPFTSLAAAIIPIILGMIIGNLDPKLRAMFAPMGVAIIPLIGFALGAGISLRAILEGGLSGILLGLTTLFIAGPFVVLADRFINRRPGYAGWAVATTAGNAVGVPAVVALSDPSLEPLVGTATAQVAASTVLTAVLTPFVVNWWAKRFGSPQFPKNGEPVPAEGEAASEFLGGTNIVDDSVAEDANQIVEAEGGIDPDALGRGETRGKRP